MTTSPHPPSQHLSSQRQPSQHQALRLWPGVLIAALLLLARYVVPVLLPEAGIYGVLAGLLGGVAILVWWAFFSRAPRLERYGGAILMIAALFLTSRLLHESVATGGMGMIFYVYSIPVLSLAFVAWAVLSRNLSSTTRRATMVATILVACGAWTLLRTGGVSGGGGSDFSWRWTETHEEKLLAQGDAELATPSLALPAEVPEADWPGFRGLRRDGIVRGIRIATDWSASPPVELWRRPIGPGWSSFAVGGDFLFTQEQLGDDEIVACYSARTGELVWRHTDAARFWESNAGPGPRSTPTLFDGRVYTLGATGITNALDAASGAVVWSRNATADTGGKVPDWGFSASPVVIADAVHGDKVVIQAGGLVAYDLETGEPQWLGPKGGGYSSPQKLTIAGTPQIVMLSGARTVGVAPANGSVLWEHPWGGGIVQPALTEDGDLLLNAGGLSGGLGVRRIAVEHGASVSEPEQGWTTKERWTTNRLKPNFNDFVVHHGHAYGFDGSIMAAIDLANGQRDWKGGRYGNGQVLLLADQDVLLVLTEEGDLALVRANPDQFTELARFPAIDGKTWNHPVLVHDRLFVRNGEEMAAYRLPLADS